MAIFDEKIDEDLIYDFKEHFGIMTSTIGLLISQVEELKQGSYQDLIEELFRIFHNIKSSSMYFELSEIFTLSSKCENLLELIIKKGYVFDTQFIFLISLVHSQFEIWLDDMLSKKDKLSKINKDIIQCRLFNNIREN